MSQHGCSCGREFKCAETLKRHTAITGHPVVLREVQPAEIEAPQEQALQELAPEPKEATHTIEWALVVLANKRAEQERYEQQLTQNQAPATPWWARVKKLVGLAA